jgi:ribosome maturation factor RimP
MRNVDVKMLEQLAGRVLEGLGYDLVDLEWKHEGGSWLLRVYLDWPELSGNAASGGVGHEDCARVSHSLGAELDVADLIHVPFTLEVSSPGLNRPLKRESDFRRFTGRKARIRTRRPVGENRRNFAGTLRGADAGRVKIEVDGQLFEIPVEEVEKANLQYEF